MGQHTPGPWQVNWEQAGIDSPTGGQIVRWGGIAGWIRGNGKANACLIAIAPELVAALRDILENGFHLKADAIFLKCGGSKGGCLLCRRREAAETLLAKTEGRPNANSL